MIVVSDSSPVRYLVLIGQIEILPRLFGGVVVPPGVVTELSRANTPSEVRQWIQSPPGWLEVRTPLQDDPKIKLGLGERQVICLAHEIKADILLIDDRKARRVATSERLVVVGVLNLLQAAADRRWLNLESSIESLRRTNFYVSERLLRHVLEVDKTRDQ